MALLALSFFGGALTILSPCVLPLLPVIIGGSMTQTHKWRPVIITASLATSLVIFTLILKWSTVLIEIPPQFWSTLSGGIVLVFGVVTLFPELWEKFSVMLHLQDSSNRMLGQSAKRGPLFGAILIGVSLGPVFSSCSPTYALILATVLPLTFAVGLLNLIAYAVGLSVVLLLIAVFGQQAVRKLKWAANPHGWFRRGLGIVFIVVGVLILTGLLKKIETTLVERGFGITQLEASLVENVSLDMNDQLNLGESVIINDDMNSVKLNVSVPQKAPELRGLQEWINSDPLTLERLKGKVVLIDFWTYSCINCIRTLPFLIDWHNRYADDGLVIIGVHAPEFAFEKISANVKQAVTEDGIQYPVALDNDFATWQAYNNRYWPAKYFIDRDGFIRHAHFGEGDYEASEAVIRLLLEEDGTKIADDMGTVDPQASVNVNQTPETYLGSDRSEPTRDLWSLTGDWDIEGQRIVAGNAAQISLQFNAKSVYLVANGEDKAIDVLLNGEAVQTVTVQGDDLYTVLDLERIQEGNLVLQVEAGTSLFAFTFGS